MRLLVPSSVHGCGECTAQRQSTDTDLHDGMCCHRHSCYEPRWHAALVVSAGVFLSDSGAHAPEWHFLALHTPPPCTTPHATTRGDRFYSGSDPGRHSFQEKQDLSASPFENVSHIFVACVQLLLQRNRDRQQNKTVIMRQIIHVVVF